MFINSNANKHAVCGFNETRVRAGSLLCAMNLRAHRSRIILYRQRALAISAAIQPENYNGRKTQYLCADGFGGGVAMEWLIPRPRAPPTDAITASVISMGLNRVCGDTSRVVVVLGLARAGEPEARPRVIRVCDMRLAVSVCAADSDYVYVLCAQAALTSADD